MNDQSIPSADLASDQVPLDVASLRHRTEPSRFALACVSSALVFGAAIFFTVSRNGAWASLAIALLLAGFLTLFWLLLQLWRVRLLGAGLKVTSESLPEVQAAIDAVRARLAYDQRVDVYIVAKSTPSVSLTSAFGTRVVVIEGGAIADLTETPGNSELVFLLSTCFGALKARHDRWNVALLSFQWLGILHFLDPLLRPWFRATIFTGDQIAYAMCADLDVSLSIVYRALVGKEIAPQVRADGLLTQGLHVRRSVIMRLSQLLAEQPHPTNRYLNLLSFAATTSESGSTYRDNLAADSRAKLDQAERLFPVRQPDDQLARAALVLAACLVLAAPFAGLASYDGSATVTPVAEAELSNTATPNEDVTDSSPTEDATDSSTSSQPTTSDTPSGEADPALVWLFERIPPRLWDGCEPIAQYANTVAELDCSSTSASVDTISYYSFPTPEETLDAFNELVANVVSEEGDCAQADDLVTTWTADGHEVGQFACYESVAGYPTVAWTHDSDAVLIVATGLYTMGDLAQWWEDSNVYREAPA